MSLHTWIETREKERRGNLVLDAVFDAEFIIVQATTQHQRQKIDRFHIHKRDGRIIYRVDYKIDEKAAITKNLVLEHISVERNGVTHAQGWVHTTIADLIVHYVPAWDRAFVTKILTLRQRWDDIVGSGCEYKKATTTSDFNGVPLAEPYNTWNYLPRVRWLYDNAFFEKVVNTNKLQLGLF